MEPIIITEGGSMWVRPDLCEKCLFYFDLEKKNYYHTKCIPGQWDYRGEDCGCTSFINRIEQKVW